MGGSVSRGMIRVSAILVLAGVITAFGLGGALAKSVVRHERLSEPRVIPLTLEAADDEQKQILAPFSQSGRMDNVFTTMARHPDLARNWLVFGRYILSQSTLPPRERELVILRMGWLCRAEYEWGQHTRLAKSVGLEEADFRRIIEGPSADGWNEHERALLRAADELRGDAFITDATWNTLAKTYSEKQMMDLVFTAGQYNLVSMALNTFGVQLDEGLEGFPE